jgi:prephenate dehydratase
MDPQINLKAIYSHIQTIKQAAEALKSMSSNFPALDRNTARILASAKMLDINISDLVELDLQT